MAIYPKVLDTYYKQPSEVIPAGRWGVNFATDTITAETISSATITVTPTGTAGDLVAGAEAIDGTKVTAAFSAGRDKVDYHVQVLATGNGGAVYDADFTVSVREV